MKEEDRGANNDKTGGPDSDNDKGGEGDKTRKKMHMLKNVLKSTTKKIIKHLKDNKSHQIKCNEVDR